MFRFVRPICVLRSPEDTIAVWRPRPWQYAFATDGWLVIAILFAMTGGGALVVGLSLAAALLSAMVAAKAVVLVRRDRTVVG